MNIVQHNHLLKSLFNFITSNISKQIEVNSNKNISIAITGPICSGKSTFAFELKKYLEQQFNINSFVISTDGFIYPKKYLIENNLMSKKGYPESYDLKFLHRVYTDVLNNKANIEIPTYSHSSYDRSPNNLIISSPSLLIFEGINVLQPVNYKEYFTFKMDYQIKIFLDVDNKTLIKWFLERKKKIFFDETKCSINQFEEQMLEIWNNINLPNNKLNILPYKEDADIIVKMDDNHEILKITNKVLEKAPQH